MKVLVVDDNPGDRALVMSSLRSAHPGMVEYAEASSLAEARSLLKSFHPHMVVLDVHLPNGQGVESVRSVAGRAPIIVCTGDQGFQLTPEQRTAYDVIDVVDKGTLFEKTPPILLRALSRTLDRARLLESVRERCLSDGE